MNLPCANCGNVVVVPFWLPHMLPFCDKSCEVQYLERIDPCPECGQRVHATGCSYASHETIIVGGNEREGD